MPSKAEISLLLERLARVLHNESHAEGLKPVQWEVLRYLGRANRFSRSPSSVTAYLGITKGTVSQTITALGRKALLKKLSADGDKRAVQLDLMPEGKRLLRSDPIANLHATIEELPQRQSEALLNALTRVLAEALEERGGQPFGICNACRHFEKNHPSGKPNRCALLEVSLSRADSDLICVEQDEAA